MADRHVDGDHSKGAALNELSSRRGTDDEPDFSSILAIPSIARELLCVVILSEAKDLCT
jgi:hypothetical protein